MPGLGENLNRLIDAATAIGNYGTSAIRVGVREEVQAMSAKSVLIVGRTAMEAGEHARAYGLGANWRFVAHAHELFGTNPATHDLVFTGDWRDREDVDAIRERAKGQGFKVPG
jgi:hypothetical protein